jgi:curved DNA-binding protein CbpA
MSLEPDFYAVLGVPADASKDEIARAYRRQALVHHPDRGGDAETFRGLHRAYDTLSDPGRRAAYDRRHEEPGSCAGKETAYTLESPPEGAPVRGPAPGCQAKGPGGGGSAAVGRGEGRAGASRRRSYAARRPGSDSVS